MRKIFILGLMGLLWTGLPLKAALSFSGAGNLGTVSLAPTLFLFTPSGGSGNYTFSYTPNATPIPNFRVINAPELPSSANSSQKGGITGIPLTTGLLSTSIRLTDNSDGTFVDEAVSFTVSPVDLAGFGPTYYSIGDTLNQRFWPVGGTPPYSYTLSGTLPPGLSLGTQVVNGVNVAVVTGQIAGNATTATTSASNGYGFTITTHDSAGNSLGRGYGMTVSAMQLQLPGGVPVNSGENRNLPNATVGLAYSETISVVGGTPPYNFSLASLNSLPNTLQLSTTSTSCTISGTPTSSTFSGRFTLVITDSASPAHYMTARLAIKILPTTPVPLALSTNTIGDNAIGNNGTWGVYATGGLPPYTFDIDPSTAAPPGLTMVQGVEVSPDAWDPDPGYLRLKVQTPGLYTFSLRVTDSAGNRVSRAYTIHIPSIGAYYTGASSIPSLTSPLADLVLGTPYSRYLIPQGGSPPYIVRPTNIPYGLNIDNTDLLSGTPQQSGIQMPLYYTLTDSAGNTYSPLGNITIASITTPGLSMNGGDFGVVQVGQQYAANLTAGNSAQNPPTFTTTIVAGALPPGLSLLTGPDFNNGGNSNIAAQLAGIPTTPGTYAFAYRVTDGLGQVGQSEVKLRVSDMAIVNTGFAPGQIGVPYSQTVDVRGGSPPYTFSLTTGNLPTGLNFNTSTGAITGTPQDTNSTSVTIQVQDGTGSILQRNFTLNIYSVQIMGPDILPDGILYEPYSYTFTANPPGSYTYTVSGQPSGLSINSSTGVLSGTIYSTSTFILTVTAYNNTTGAVGVRNFTLLVSTLSNLPYIAGLPTGVISVGGVPTAYLGDFVAGTNIVTVLGVGGGGVQPYTISLVPPSTLPPGLSLAVASTYQGSTNFGRWAIAGVATTPGLYSFTLQYADTSGLTEQRVVAMNIANLGVATTAPSIGFVNQPYSAQLYGTGGNGTYNFSLLSESYLLANVMPPGLNLSSTGLISGTPTSTGVFSPIIQLTSGGVTRRVTVTITINAAANETGITFGLGPIVGSSSTGRGSYVVLTPSGGAGTHTWSLVSGALPPGMQLLSGSSLPAGYAPPTALIAGAATTPGTYNFRIRVDDSTGNFGIRDAQWIFSPMRNTPINSTFFENTSFPPGQVGSPYSFSLGALNSTAPLTFTTETGTLLPPGVTLSSTGVLSGTPMAAGNFVLYYHITDGAGNVRYSSTSLIVNPAGSALGINTQAGLGTLLTSATVGASYSLTLNQLLSTGYGTAPFTWTLYNDGGVLPPGLQIVPGAGSASATLSGTATTAGTYFFSLLVTDSAGRQALIKSVQLTVSVLGMAPVAATLPPATAGMSYQTFITASGGTPPYTFSVEYDSDMPPGLSLSPGGVLSGTPGIAGPFVLYFIVKDSANNTFRQQYYLTVSPAGTVIPALTVVPSSINLTYTIGDPAPAPIPISVGSTATPLSYTISAGAGQSWLSSSATGGTTTGTTNAVITIGTMKAGTYNSALTFTSSAASNSPFNLPVTLTIVNAVACTYAVSPPNDTILSGGGNKSFYVYVPSSCAWSVDPTTVPGWIHITSPSSGTGSGTVSFTVDPNTQPSQQTATIMVNGVAYTLTEFGVACSFSLTSQSVNIVAGGGSGPIGVTASASGCSWTTSQVDSWISVTGTSPNPASGTGSANIAIQSNSLSTNRTGHITIAGQTLTVNQAGTACSYSLNSAGQSVSSAGGLLSVGVNVASGCTWSANTGPSWISATSGTPGNGNGTLQLNIAANSTSSARQANVMVSGIPFQVTQAGVPCDFSLSANNPVQPATGGSGSISITTGPSCGWTASSPANFITPMPNSGTGPTTVNFTVGANNSGVARSATLTVAGQNLTVNQNGPLCTYSLQSVSATIPGTGGAGTVGVITASGCGPWTGSSNAPWLHYTGPASDSGPDSVSYSVDPNLTGAQLFGTLTIAGQPFLVTEPPAACAVTLNSASLGPVDQFGSGGPFQFTFTTNPAACNVPIMSNTSWLTITDLSTPGTVTFTVATNTYAAQRSGTIMVGGQGFTVTQAPSTCGYTLTSFAATFGYAGGTGTAPMTYSPAQCGPPPVIVNGPPGMVTLGPVTTGTLNGVPAFFENYGVSIYTSFINYTRTTQLSIDGQIYTVKQNSW